MVWPLLTLAGLFFTTTDTVESATPIAAVPSYTAPYTVRLAANTSVTLAESKAKLSTKSPAKSLAKSSAKSMCRPDEVPLFSCPVGHKMANLCAGQNNVAYRFGHIGQTPELSILSTPDWPNVRMGNVVGGGGGQETHIRFTRGDFHYMLFEGYPGQYHDAANGPWAGLTVINGNVGNQIMRHDCALPAASAGWAEEVGKRAPNPDTLYEEEGSAFDGWF